MLAQKRATTSRPSYSKGIGGIEMKTSSVRRATSASRSADSYALGLHEGQGDGFGLLVAGLRAERHLDRALEEGVGKWLKPYDLAEPGRLGRFNLGHVPLLGRSSAGRATRVEAPVGGDPVEPGAERGASLESRETLPGGQHGVLKGVLGVLEGAEHPVAVHL